MMNSGDMDIQRIITLITFYYIFIHLFTFIASKKQCAMKHLLIQLTIENNELFCRYST